MEKIYIPEEKTCKTCFWSSMAGFCTEGSEPPRPCKGVCDKYTKRLLTVKTSEQ